MRDADIVKSSSVLTHFIQSARHWSAVAARGLFEHNCESAQDYFHTFAARALCSPAKLVDHVFKPLEALDARRIPAFPELHRAVKGILAESSDVDRRAGGVFPGLARPRVRGGVESSTRPSTGFFRHVGNMRRPRIKHYPSCAQPGVST